MNSFDLDQQFADLCAHPRFAAATRTKVQHGWIVTLPDQILPEGWSHATARLLFHVTDYFPSQRPEYFWTREDLHYGDRCVPQWTRRDVRYNPPEILDELTWWGYRPMTWSAVGDTLTTYAHFIRHRFEVRR